MNTDNIHVYIYTQSKSLSIGLQCYHLYFNTIEELYEKYIVKATINTSF